MTGHEAYHLTGYDTAEDGPEVEVIRFFHLNPAGATGIDLLVYNILRETRCDSNY